MLFIGETNEPIIIDDVYNFDAELEDGGELSHNFFTVFLFNLLIYFDLLGEKKTPKGKRKSRVQGDGSDEVKKEFACDLCDRSFSTLGVGSKVRMCWFHLQFTCIYFLLFFRA